MVIVTARSKRRRVCISAATALMAAAGLLGLVGCSSRERAAAAVCAEPGVSADEIRIGVVYPEHGLIGAALGAARSGIEARIQQANAKGGVDGRRITYLIRDDNADLRLNQASIEDLLKAGVFGLIEATTVASGGADLLRSEHVPAVGLPTEPVWADPDYPNMMAYPGLLGSHDPTDVFGTYARTEGGTHAAIITGGVEATSRRLADRIAQRMASAGIPSETLVYDANVGDARQLGQRIRTSGADTIVSTIDPDATATVLAGVREAGTDAKVILTVGGYGQDQLQKFGAGIAGVSRLLTQTPFEAHVPAQDAYHAAVAAYAPELQPPDQDVAYGSYVTADILLRGLAAAGPCPSRQGFIDGLRRVTNYDANGLLPGPVDFAKGSATAAVCYAAVRVNQAGTAYNVVPNTTPGAPSRDNWCA